MKNKLRIIATFALIAYAYGELAAHVYPFVLLPQLGVQLRVVLLTLFAVLHAGTSFGWRAGFLMFFATALVTWLFEQAGVGPSSVIAFAMGFPTLLALLRSKQYIKHPATVLSIRDGNVFDIPVSGYIARNAMARKAE